VSVSCMQSNRPPLSYDVFVSPEKRFTVPRPQVGDPPAWHPMTSTVIFGPRCRTFRPDRAAPDPLFGK